MKNAFIAIVILILLAGGAFLLMKKDEKPAANTTTSTQTEEQTEPTETEQETSDVAETNQVVIKDFSFTPAAITVKKGTTVTWTNQDSTVHTVTSDEGSLMDSGSLGQGKTYTVTFNEAGTFAYHCEPHPAMTGTVTVTD